MKMEKGEYLSYQNIREDAINEIKSLKQRLATNMQSMQNMVVGSGQNGGQGTIDSRLANIRQTLINQVDSTINSIKQTVIQDGGNQYNSD